MNTGVDAGLSAGFAEPVADAQRCFRAVLDAMARPGCQHQVSGVIPPAPLSVACAAVLLTLVDHETPLWLDPGAQAARDWIAFHTGAPIVRDPMRAAFAVALTLPELSLLSPGTHEAPETAATVIVAVRSLIRGPRYRLGGPGLKGSAVLTVDGLPATFPESWMRNHALYPRGVDLVLCAGETLCALPRSVMVQEV